MNETKPTADYGLVSIIMPNYNCAQYLPETIKSVIDQTYQNWELLFVDDCSTDDSVKIVESNNDPRIRVFKNEKNSGAAFSRNVAIREANGRWIAFLDSDDLWASEKLLEQLDFMEDKQCALSFTHFYFDKNDGKLIEFAPPKDIYTYEDILKHNYMACPTVMYDTARIDKVEMPVKADKREDFGCWLRILRQGIKAYCLHNCLVTVKIHTGSVSYNKVKMVKWQWNVYRNVEKLPLIKCVYYMIHWAVKGFLKYR